MSELQYPVGMSAFPQLIKEGYIYVDKTAYIKPLISNGKFKFLSRPRRFAFITGVARFAKVSIFSDINNLNDISMVDDFADICGWSFL